MLPQAKVLRAKVLRKQKEGRVPLRIPHSGTALVLYLIEV